MASMKAAAEMDGDLAGTACTVRHDVSIRVRPDASLRWRHIPSKVSAISIGLPQHGQSRTGAAKASVSALSACFRLDAGAAKAIKMRIVARLSAREPLASSP